jgi:hypothetical protein
MYLPAFDNLEVTSKTSQPNLSLSPSPSPSCSFIDYFGIQIELTRCQVLQPMGRFVNRWFSGLPSDVECVMVSKFVDIKNLEFVQTVMHRE